MADRQRAVVVGVIGKLRRDEAFARGRAYRGQHPGVPDSAWFELFHYHTLASNREINRHCPPIPPLSLRKL